MRALYIMYKKTWSFHVFFLAGLFSVFTLSAQEIWTENFDYNIGDLLTEHGWIANVSGEPAMVVSGLSFDGYAATGIGGAVQLEGDGEAVYTPFPKVSTGCVYVAFLVQINGAGGTNGQYFLHLWDGELPTWMGGTSSKFDYDARVYCSNDGKNIGLSFSDNQKALYTTSDFIDKYRTYLMVLKYEVIPGNNNDRVSLYVFDAMPSGAEPENPTLGPIVSSSGDKDDIFPAGIGLRQGHQDINIIVDGIRVATSWEAAVLGITSEVGNITLECPRIWLSENKVWVSSLVAENVYLYDITGMQVAVRYCNVGKNVLDVNLGSGIYLIKMSGKTYKIIIP